MNHDLQIISISGIDCYEWDGTAYLKLDTVARGLGFTEIAASGNECVRWRTVRKYLAELGIATSCDGNLPDFIPENIFYRLAMKAKNEAAESFQAKIADEVIPAIRKHGAYMTPEVIERTLTDPDYIIQLATTLKQERQKRKALEEKVEADAPAVRFANAITGCDTNILVRDMAKLLKQNGVDTGEKRFYWTLRNDGFLIKGGSDYNMPTQRAMEMGLFFIKETPRFTKDSGIIDRVTTVTPAGQRYFLNRYAAPTPNSLKA